MYRSINSWQNICYCIFCSVVIFFLTSDEALQLFCLLLNITSHCTRIPRGQTTGLPVAAVFFMVWKLPLHYIMQTEGGVSSSFVVHNPQYFLHTKPNNSDMGRPEMLEMLYPLWWCSIAEGGKYFANNLWNTARQFSSMWANVCACFLPLWANWCGCVMNKIAFRQVLSECLRSTIQCLHNCLFRAKTTRDSLTLHLKSRKKKRSFNKLRVLV
jgi:hypothetical protein